MQLLGIKLDLKWLVQVICTVFLIAFGLLHVVKSAASKYFEVDDNFESGGGGAGGYSLHNRKKMSGPAVERADCAVCGNHAPKKCSRCKSVRYCSQACQSAHWKSEHKYKCKVFQPSTAQLIENGNSKPIKQLKKVLFPYDEFIELYNWEKVGFRPCGLLNCGNSCFANVVLQCLSSTRPLVAYLLNKGHKKGCRRNDWCFMCELQSHLERASHSPNPFSPISILSRLPNIGGNLGYGRQEDAHEFMRFAIDTMQSVCLDEFGGEKAVHPSAQETTLVQHIFGGRLQSQVICTKCDKVSNQYENMMDLTVEIHGDASSLEECLEQFTEEEHLHGDNMYKCDGCNDYVQASKRLTVRRAPNILTVALKRFQSGRFGKLNKKINFPETLDLSPYMSESGDGSDIYKLYSVVVHLDMLNASFFGHYICYTKDFLGNWCRIDDCKVTNVELEEVLSQGAYMLLYSRVSPRPSGLMTTEVSREENSQRMKVHLEPCVNGQAESLSPAANISVTCNPSSEEFLVETNDNALAGELMEISSNVNTLSEGVPSCETESSVERERKDTRQGGQRLDEADSTVSLSATREISIYEECPASANAYTRTRSSPGNAVIGNGDLGLGPSSKRDDICCNGHAGVEEASRKDLGELVPERSPCYTNGDVKNPNLLQEVP